MGDNPAVDDVCIRPAERRDADAVAAIWNEGIAGREATFETEPRGSGDLGPRLESPRFPWLVAERDGEIVGWAALAPYSDRPAYAGIAECSVYVAGASRGQGIGTTLTGALADEARRRGFHKLLAKLFETNEASARLIRRCGFREVGVHRRHGQLDGEWRDVRLVERLLA